MRLWVGKWPCRTVACQVKRLVAYPIIVLLLTSWPSWSQHRFHPLTTGDGLSHNTVLDILEDHKGFLWLGTADGLNRYDGERFQVYRRAARDTNSLSSNYINCLLEDRQHRLWVGTNGGGLNLLDKTGTRFIHVGHTGDGTDLSSITITDLAQDERGFVWASTNGNGLLKINPSTRQMWRINSTNSRLPSNFVSQICPDHQGNLWVGSFDGMVQRLRLSDYAVSPYPLPKPVTKLSRGPIMSITCDKRGNLWVGTQGAGLFRKQPHESAFRLVFYRAGIVEDVNNARSLYEAPDGRFWLGTDDGVVVAEDTSFRRTTHLQHRSLSVGGLSTHAVVCVRGDRRGNVWVGTWEAGLNVHFAQPDPFNVFMHRPGLPNTLLTPVVSTLATDSTGCVWVGSSRGLTFIDPKTNTTRYIQHRPDCTNCLPGNDVSELVYLSETALLATIWNKGTVLLNPKTGVVYRIPALDGQTIHFVLSEGGHWVRVVAKDGRAWRMNRHTGEVHSSPGLPQVMTKSKTLLQTADGLIWGGTFGDGLLAFDPRTATIRQYQSEARPGSLYDSHVICLFEDRHRRLWVGTTGGLHRFDKRTGRFVLLDTDNGLTNNAIMSITQDKAGYLWVATNEGLCQVDENGTVTRTYRREDGLAGNDFSERAVSRSPDGTLFFGGKHGLTVFDPKQLITRDRAIPVYLTDLKLFNKSVAAGTPGLPLPQALIDTKKLTLRYDQSVFTFDFSSVLFQAHRNVRYAYKLDGFEEAWNYVGSQHSATYTNLNPDTYLFRVKASQTDDFTNAPERVLTLTILPPWYRTGWSYGVYILLITGLLLGIRRLIQLREGFKTKIRAEHLETEKARELDRLRSGFFANISHEFRTPLTLILTPLEHFLTDQTPDSRRPLWQTMHQNANRLLRLINQLLDLAKLESNSLRPDINQQDVMPFVRQVAGTFTAQANQQGVAFWVSTEPDTALAWFDPDILEKVLYNLIANALKFTHKEGTIWVRCFAKQVDNQFCAVLEVEDTGIGISAEHKGHIFERFYQRSPNVANGQGRAKKAGTGIGLALTRELIELHRGQIQVESQPGLGTVFTVTLPIDASAFPNEWLSATTNAWIPTQDEPLVPVMAPAESPITAVHDLPLVLVVEDDDDLRQYIAGCFRQHYRVLSAANGLEALAQAQNEIPDLIVSDWLMPDMDGLQLCEALKSDERTSHVPLILLTSRSSTESKLEGLGVGADDYITKPFTLSVLLLRARNLIQSRQLLRAKYSRVLTLKPTDVVVESAEEVFLRKVMALIDQHLTDPDLDVQRLERELALSNTQLYRKLKALTGKGGNELIRTMRLQRAAQQLQTGGQTVAEVAYAVGFNDPNYFIRAFKKEFGQSPGEWGKQGVEIA